MVANHDFSGVPHIPRGQKEYDSHCSLCRRDKLQPQPWANNICWATTDASHPGKAMVVLDRHTATPRAEELRHLREIAEMLWPGKDWRYPVSMPQHFHLHEQ